MPKKFAELKICRIFAIPKHGYSFGIVRELSSVGSERLPYKQRVGGSTPSAPTKSSAVTCWTFFCACPHRMTALVPQASSICYSAHPIILPTENLWINPKTPCLSMHPVFKHTPLCLSMHPVFKHTPPVFKNPPVILHLIQDLCPATPSS